jgi:ribose/xylose/arabinose/galactoside ABC-type transport system permease subunit
MHREYAMSDPTPRSRTPQYIKSALTGAMLGLATVVCGTLWQTFTRQIPFDGHPLGEVGAVALIAGGVVGFVHHGTRRIRTRGRLHEYGSWMMACTIGVFVVIAPELPQRGFWWTVLFALWLGTSCGLAFGVINRQLSGHRW